MLIALHYLPVRSDDSDKVIPSHRLSLYALPKQNDFNPKRLLYVS